MCFRNEIQKKKTYVVGTTVFYFFIKNVALFSRLHERLGPETREKEYKAAQGGFMYNELRDTISKYACGFLNSQVEGKLMLGVNDDGRYCLDQHY